MINNYAINCQSSSVYIHYIEILQYRKGYRKGPQRHKVFNLIFISILSININSKQQVPIYKNKLSYN